MQYAIVFGGKSYEHEISIVSAIALKEKLPDALFIFLDEERDFYLIDAKDLKSKYFSAKEYKRAPKLEMKRGGFYQKGLLKEKRVPFDIAINLVHGGDGEDGKLASLFEFYAIPYIGPRIEGSVISYNKLFTKLYATYLGCNVIEYQVLRKERIEPVRFSYPFIIKPARLGSSIGVSVVRSEDELSYALDIAFEFDDMVIVEPFIEDIKEYNLAGCKGLAGFIFSILEEPKKREFLDFEQKYLDFARTSEVQEAKILPVLKEKIEHCFKNIYDPLFAGALIRIDFFVHKDTIYLNEINPIPGSLANYLFKDFGSTLDALARNLPKQRDIPIEYHYINSISAKK